MCVFVHVVRIVTGVRGIKYGKAQPGYAGFEEAEILCGGKERIVFDCSLPEVQWQERGIQVVQCNFFFLFSGPSAEWWGNIGREGGGI